MRLRWQLLLVSLLTLALPWAGLRYTLALERTQRADRQTILLENAALVERILSARLEHLPDPLLEYRDRDPAREVAARDLTAPVVLDGFADDWQPALAPADLRTAVVASNGSPLRLTWQAGLDDRFLYLQLSVQDADQRYRRTLGDPAPPHDLLVMIFDAPDGERTFALLDTPAPGPVTARLLRYETPLPRVRGHWRATASGHAIELRVPLDMVGDRFGFAFLDADPGGDGGTDGRDGPGRYGRWIGPLVSSASPEDQARAPHIRDWRRVQPGLLIRPARRVTALLDQLRRPGQRLSVVDSAGWRIATTGTLDDAVTPARGAGSPGDATAGEGGGEPLVASVLRLLLRREDAGMPILDANRARPSLPHLTTALGGQEAARRYFAPRAAAAPGGAREDDVPGEGSPSRRDAPVVLSAAHPIFGLTDQTVLGAVLIEQSTENFVSLTTPALTGLMHTTLLASLAAAVALLAFASLLSLRIARLRNAADGAAESVLRPGGAATTRTALPLRRDGDELGDLARSFGVLLERLRQQADYLQTLAQKLSHELRTPLSVVQSSLENLAADPTLAPEAGTYVARASSGAQRLAAILKAMSEATRLEQSLASVEFERFDLRALLQGVREGYAAAYAQQQVRLHLGAAGGDARSAGGTTADAGPRCEMTGAPELIAQALDKLVDNAVSFSPPDRPVHLTLTDDGTRWAVSVRNEGPPLPEGMDARLFDSMVSVRALSADGTARAARGAATAREPSPHLGLGLYVVRLVAQLHRGKVEARNVDAPPGVEFVLRLPKTPEEARPGD